MYISPPALLCGEMISKYTSYCPYEEAVDHITASYNVTKLTNHPSSNLDKMAPSMFKQASVYVYIEIIKITNNS